MRHFPISSIIETELIVHLALPLKLGRRQEVVFVLERFDVVFLATNLGAKM